MALLLENEILAKEVYVEQPVYPLARVLDLMPPELPDHLITAFAASQIVLRRIVQPAELTDHEQTLLQVAHEKVARRSRLALRFID